MKSLQSFRKIPQAILGVSEPNPAWFGNKANEPSNPNWTNPNWLKSLFHFSFAEYHNPDNMGFGPLRVMNDDLVQPARGFDAHPHQNAEICTYIVNGHLTHKDSMGTQETLTRGDIQFMTAGTGVTHSEHNLDPTHPLRFIQIWINPRRRGLPPNYGSAIGNANDRHNQWAHLVSDVDDSATVTPIKINQDVNIFVAELEPYHTVTFQLREGRQGYLLAIEGTTDVFGPPGVSQTLEAHDAAEIFGENTFEFQVGGHTNLNSHLLLVEMAYTGPGRTDL